jgi:hypothetical protein
MRELVAAPYDERIEGVARDEIALVPAGSGPRGRCSSIGPSMSGRTWNDTPMERSAAAATELSISGPIMLVQPVHVEPAGDFEYEGRAVEFERPEGTEPRVIRLARRFCWIRCSACSHRSRRPWSPSSCHPHRHTPSPRIVHTVIPKRIGAQRTACRSVNAPKRFHMSPHSSVTDEAARGGAREWEIGGRRGRSWMFGPRALTSDAGGNVRPLETSSQ